MYLKGDQMFLKEWKETSVHELLFKVVRIA